MLRYVHSHDSDYPDLFPKRHFLKQYKIDGNEQAYTNAYYTEVLSKLDPKKVWIDLADKTILCWEKAGSFCHRRLVAEWLQNNLDVSIPELKHNVLDNRN